MNPAIENHNYWSDPRVIAALATTGDAHPVRVTRDKVVLAAPCNVLPSCTVCPHREHHHTAAKDKAVPCAYVYPDGEAPEDCDETMEVAFPARFAVCPLCSGTGKVVDPDIDCCGLTREDFDDDPDFEEDYFDGVYDVTCPQCRGERVVPAVDQGALPPALRVLYDGWRAARSADAEYAQECAAERRMGC